MNSDFSGCGGYRITEVYNNIQSDIKFVISHQTKDVYQDGKLVHAVLIQRPADKILTQFCIDAKKEGIKVVVEMDDDLHNIHSSNPAKGFYTQDKINDNMNILRLCDFIHCSTDYLKHSLKHPKKTTVFENALNLKKYNHSYDKRYDVMWTGSETHADSLMLIKGVIKQLLEQGVKVGLMSGKKFLESIFDPHPNLDILDLIPFNSYYHIPALTKVFLTPLPDNHFNRSKSCLKIIEAAAWGVPCISSDTEPYRKFHNKSDGGNILVSDKFSDWMKVISSLLDNQYLWQEKSEKSFAAVKNIYNLELVNKKRADWWSSIL